MYILRGTKAAGGPMREEQINVVAHAVVAAVLFALTIAFYAGHSAGAHRVQTWGLSIEPCVANEPHCAQPTQSAMPPLQERLNCSSSVREWNVDPSQDGGSALCLLSGLSYEYDRTCSGFFSYVDPVFLCASAQMLLCALSVGAMLPPVGVAMLLLYGLLSLFAQSAWHIPLNNLLVVETCFTAAVLRLNNGADTGSRQLHAIFFILPYCSRDNRCPFHEQTSPSRWR